MLKHTFFLSVVFVILILIDSQHKTYKFFEIEYFTEKKGPTEIYYAETALDFAEERSLAVDLNLRGAVRFPIDESVLPTINYLRLDPCSCDGEFQIKDWGLIKGLRKVSLPVDTFAPFYQVEVIDDRFRSTGFDPRLHSESIDFSDAYQSLFEINYINYIKLFFIGIAFYLLAILGYKKITYYRFIFIFPLLFALSLYFELRNGWKFLLFSYQQEAPGEALQAMLLLFSAIIAFYIFYNTKQNKKVKILHLAIGTVLLFLFLEETSYLQRVFLFQTPGFIEDRNYQNEATLHNLAGVQEKTVLLYILIGLYGTFSWILLYVPSIKEGNFIKFIITPRVTIFYYFTLFTFFYFWASQSRFNFVIPNIQESFELLLAIAILIFILRNFYQLFILRIEIKEKLGSDSALDRNI